MYTHTFSNWSYPIFPRHPFLSLIIREVIKRSANCVLMCVEYIPSRRNYSFSRVFPYISFPVTLSLSLYFPLVLSGSQWRCRLSSFGSMRLLANVPISEGRVRTTNHRCRGRGERLGYVARFCALGCFHSLVSCRKITCFFSFISFMLLLETISLFLTAVYVY